MGKNISFIDLFLNRDKITLIRHYAFTHNKVNDILSDPDDLFGTPVSGDAADIRSGH